MAGQGASNVARLVASACLGAKPDELGALPVELAADLGRAQRRTHATTEGLGEEAQVRVGQPTTGEVFDERVEHDADGQFAAPERVVEAAVETATGGPWAREAASRYRGTVAAAATHANPAPWRDEPNVNRWFGKLRCGPSNGRPSGVS